MEEAEDQNGPTALASERNLSRILNVGAECFDRERVLRGGFAKLREKGSIAVDPEDRDAGCGRCERVASAAAREVDDRAEFGSGSNSLELVAEETRRRRSLRHGLNRHHANRQ
jgi:hypothetical protein